jgi:flavin reductase (DIM6/NTAB) family NADH-FMN oxidoreductase RutF
MTFDRIEIGPYEYMNYFMAEAAHIVSMNKDGRANIMAVLWKTIGQLWMLPVITIAVSPSRFSFKYLTEGIQEFTVNIPSKKIADSINVTGILSGRNIDKFKEAGLEPIKGKKTKVPTVANSILSYECKIVHTCESGNMAPHRLFIGQILAAYASKEILNK